MRINKFIALASGLSRRSADQAIRAGRVRLNGVEATLGQEVETTDVVLVDGKPLQAPDTSITIMLNKPVGYVVSREGQGSRTVYDLLPENFIHLKPIGRLDKYSSGLLLLSTDGQLAHELTHPKFSKTKIYEVVLDRPLQPKDQHTINDGGVQLEDGLSQLTLEPLTDSRKSWRVTMQQGRNRQIRRTFSALGYRVARLHRTTFGPYTLGELAKAHYVEVDKL